MMLYRTYYRRLGFLGFLGMLFLAFVLATALSGVVANYTTPDVWLLQPVLTVVFTVLLVRFHRKHSSWQVPVCPQCGVDTDAIFPVCRVCGTKKWPNDGAQAPTVSTATQPPTLAKPPGKTVARRSQGS